MSNSSFIWGFCTVWNMGWNHPCGNVAGISATPQKTNTSPNINGWKMHFNSPFCCRHLSFRGCISLQGSGCQELLYIYIVSKMGTWFSHKKHRQLLVVLVVGIFRTTPTSPMEEDALMVGLTECLQMGATNLQVGEYGGRCCYRSW